jgi:hypothetical protein
MVLTEALFVHANPVVGLMVAEKAPTWVPPVPAVFALAPRKPPDPSCAL